MMCVVWNFLISWIPLALQNFGIVMNDEILDLFQLGVNVWVWSVDIFEFFMLPRYIFSYNTGQIRAINLSH